MSRLIRTYAVYTISQSIYRSIRFNLTAMHTQYQAKTRNFLSHHGFDGEDYNSRQKNPT